MAEERREVRELFYVLDSGGYFTNLQLFALGEAKRYWRSLQDEYRQRGAHTEYLRERCVFTTIALGISLSQLLGQNNPSPNQERIPAPKALFRRFIEHHELDGALIPRFDELIEFYDAARHFGATNDQSKYEMISRLDFQKTEEMMETGLDVWNAVLAAFERNPQHNLTEFDARHYPPEDEMVFHIPEGEE